MINPSSLIQEISSSSVGLSAAKTGETAIAFYNAALPALEIFAVLVAVALIAGTIAIIIRTGWFSLRVDRVRDVILKTDMPKKRASEAWAAAQKCFFSGTPNDLKMAIVQADNILDDALHYAGIRGSNLGDRLKNVRREQIPNLEDVWTAHKLRNEIAHGANFTLKRAEAERALDTYEVALKNLGVFDQNKKPEKK